MGIFSDLLVNSTTLDITIPTTALDKGVKREIDDIISRGDIEVPTSLQQRDEVQEIVQYAGDPSSGNFTLTVTLRNGETFTTANIAFNANIAAIEGAIDTAASGVVTGWTNGDIAVTGGATLLAAGGNVILTFSGASVTNINHAQTVFTDVDISGGALAPTTQNTTTVGQTNRPAWAALEALSVVSLSDVPNQGDNPVSFSTPGDPSFGVPSKALIRLLADEAAIEDDNLAVRDEILAATGLTV